MGESTETSDGTDAGAGPHVLTYATPATAERGRSLAWAGIGCCMLALGVVGVMPWVGSVGLFAFLVALPVAGLGLGIAAKRWAIDETGTVRRTARRAMVFAGIELALLLTVALVIPSSGRPRESANRVKCGSNLRQIGQAITLYADANGGRFPTDLPTLVLDDDITPEVLVCPSSSAERATGPTTAAAVQTLRTEAGHCSYVYAGAGLTSATATAAHVIAYDFGGNHGKQGINVLYGDWIMEWLPQREVAYLVAELNAGHNPPRAKAAPVGN